MGEELVLSKLTRIQTVNGEEECVHLFLRENQPVAFLQKSCQNQDITLYTVSILDDAYTVLSFFNWQKIQNEWRGTNPIVYNNNVYTILPSINFRSQHENIDFFINGPRFKQTTIENNQKRVIYLGYWLSDADIPTLVQN
jgi:hypothetical protein